MDLGYGSKNQALGEAVSTALLAQTRAREAALNDELNQYDSLLEAGDSELEKLRERRLAHMKKASEQRAKWKEMGHGAYEALGSGRHGADVAREFFEASKKSERMVVHFHRPTTRMCDVFHRHLEVLAPRHLETRFVKIDVEADGGRGGEGATSFLVEKLGIVVMPTIVIIKDRKAVHHIRGFDELGGTPDFSVEALEYVLSSHGGLTLREDMTEPPKELLEAANRGVGVNDLRIRTIGRGGYRGAYGKSEDFDED